MKASTIASAALAAGVAIAAPVENEKRQQQNIDYTVLQFALTLEHLENFFYKQALKNYTEAQFAAAGLDSSYYRNLQYIAFDEQTHTETLTAALQAAGQQPVAACTYAFPSTDVHSFVTLSSVIEGVGTSAYLGGAPLITSKDYLTAAGSILVDEALHTSLQRYSVGNIASANPFGTPLDPTSVYSLAAPFIKSCPASNPPLPFTPFPALTVKPTAASKVKARHWETWSPAPAPATTSAAPKPTSPPQPTLEYGAPSPGAALTVEAAKAVPAGSFVTYINGLAITSVPGQISGADVTSNIPTGTGGQTYVFITSANVTGKFDDSKVLFGPAIVEVNPAAPALDYNEG